MKSLGSFLFIILAFIGFVCNEISVNSVMYICVALFIFVEIYSLIEFASKKQAKLLEVILGQLRMMNAGQHEHTKKFEELSLKNAEEILGKLGKHFD